MTLDEIGVKHGTDKASIRHGYLDLYELLFSKWKGKRVHLLEVGFQFGNSLRTWAEYFPYGDITGIDLVDNGVKEEGFKLVVGNAYMGYMKGELNPPYDIIIEDGSHVPSDQAYFVSYYLPMLRDGGIAVVEDVLSREVIPTLEAALPKGFQCTTVEMAKGASLVDSRLFICWK